MFIFSCQNVFLKSDTNQLTSADIGLEFVNLVEIKDMRHVFYSFLNTELEFEGKNNNFSKNKQHFKNVIKFQKFDKNDNILKKRIIFAIKFKLRV